VKGGTEKLCIGQLLAEKPEKGKALWRREVSGDWKGWRGGEGARLPVPVLQGTGEAVVAWLSS